LPRLNIFWKNAFEAYCEFYDKIEVENSNNFLREPIFLNNKFKIDQKTIYFRKWIDKEIYFVKDLVAENGNFLSHEHFRNKFHLEVSFLEFYGCINSIKLYAKENAISIDNNECNTEPLAYRKLLTPLNKGSKFYYDILLNQSEVPKAFSNWNSLLEEDINWPRTFAKVRKIKEVKLKWFQMKICHRILVSNVILKEMGIQANNLCSFCRGERDSIAHYLVECEYVASFWGNLERWMKEKGGMCDRMSFNKILLLFGNKERVRTDEGFDSIILYAKYFVYRCKLNNIRPLLNVFLLDLKYKYQVEEFMYKMEMEHHKFTLKWLPYVNMFL
jgi:hypothetical protein